MEQRIQTRSGSRALSRERASPHFCTLSQMSSFSSTDSNATDSGFTSSPTSFSSLSPNSSFSEFPNGSSTSAFYPYQPIEVEVYAQTVDAEPQKRRSKRRSANRGKYNGQIGRPPKYLTNLITVDVETQMNRHKHTDDVLRKRRQKLALETCRRKKDQDIQVIVKSLASLLENRCKDQCQHCAHIFNDIDEVNVSELLESMIEKEVKKRARANKKQMKIE